MLRDYHFPANETLVRRFAAESNLADAFDELARPLHEELYKAQTFDFLNALTDIEQLILSLDYVRAQIGQGGLIQLIQNGYAPLLVTVIEATQKLQFAPNLQKALDDALKVYVLNHEALSRETTPEEFGRLYHEFREFEPLEGTFESELPGLITQIVSYSIDNVCQG